MLKKFTPRVLCGAFLMAVAFSATARIVSTPVEAFVHREKQQRDFRPVPGFWGYDHEAPTDLASEYVSDAVFLTLDQQQLRTFMSEAYPAVSFRVQMADRVVDIDLVRYENYAADFRVEAVSGTTARPYDYKPGLHYRGVVAGSEGSIAAFSFFDEGVYGIFSMPGDGGNYVLAPNNLLPEAERTGRYLVYNDAGLVDKNPPLCSTDNLPPVESPLTAGKTSRSTYNTCKDLEVYYQADYRTYQRYNNDINQVVDYITYMHNVVATLYANEQIYASIKIIRVNDANDPYWGLPSNSSIAFLNKFGDITRNELYGADIGVLLSTKGGTMGGVAWLDGLCLSYNYQSGPNAGHVGPYAFCNITGSTQNPFPTYSWDASMVTHEIGHLIGSPHTHSCSWPGGPIDGCNPADGNCQNNLYPSFPPGGGTIMSYCHNGGTVSFTKGFGPLPGNLVRNNMRNGKSCVSEYLVNTPLMASATTLTANRECTDASGLTYYYNDNNTADKSDDRLVLKIRKHGNNIGSMELQAFTVSTTTAGGFGSGSGIKFTLPAGTPHHREQAFAAQRYFQVRTVQPSGQAVMEVILPFGEPDKEDLMGSLREDRRSDLSQVTIYTQNNVLLDPNPEGGLTGVSASDLQVYQYADAASLTDWSVSSADSVYFAHLHATGFTGGAMYVNTPFAASVAAGDLQQAVRIYPNPARDQWHIVLPQDQTEETMTFTLHAADGRIMSRQSLKAGVVNRISAEALPAGIYFFRISGGSEVYNGTLERL